MNSWGNEQFAIQNMMHGIHNMIPNMMPPGAMTPALVPPLSMIGEFHQMQMQPMLPHHMNHPQPTGQFIGPVIPETVSNEVVTLPKSDGKDNEPGQTQDKRQSRDRSDRHDRERERAPNSSTVLERGRRRSRSRNRDHNNKNKNRGDRNHNNHSERYSKWKTNNKAMQQPDLMQPHNNMMPGQQNMMQFGNMMQNMQNPMLNQQMDLSNMPNMMPNMIMMNQQIQMTNQHMYFSNGVILPALPGTTPPKRRERPPGCRSIFIGGLPKNISIDHIKEIFQRFGEIDEVKVHKQGICQIRYEKSESVELSFSVSGSRIKCHDQMERDATTVFVDYALNREDQNDSDKTKRKHTPTPPRVEQFNATTFMTVGEKIKSDNEFAEAAPTLAAWLERGECNKKNANTFYALIQATNNQLRRLFNEKMQIDDEYQALRASIKDKFGHIIMQFEQVAKILTAAKLQRVSDHFSKQQRRNIEMWLKMTEELDGIKDEFNVIFDDEEMEKGAGKSVPLEKYEQLRIENESLTFELEGYKNEAHLAKDEAERKFEKFKAHFIAQQALQNNKQVYPPLPPQPMPSLSVDIMSTMQKQPASLTENFTSSGTVVKASEAKLISLLSSFLMVHPLGASLDYLVSYVKSLAPDVTQSTVLEVLKKYNDVFHRKTTGVGARIENKWCFVIFDGLKME